MEALGERLGFFLFRLLFWQFLSNKVLRCRLTVEHPSMYPSLWKPAGVTTRRMQMQTEYELLARYMSG